jgi:hypothetical protein
MQHLNKTPALTLYWIQPKWGKPIYELHSDEELFCTLRWLTYNKYDPVSVVSADGQWTLIFQWPWTVHIVSSDSNIAVSKSKFRQWWWGNETVEFANGSIFHWRMNFWHTRCTFNGEGTGNLLFFKVARFPPFKLKVRVDMAQGAKDLPESSLLAALGLYLWFRNMDFKP